MRSLKVTITLKADKDEDDIYEYIKKEFGENHAVKFRQKLIQLSPFYQNSLL